MKLLPFLTVATAMLGIGAVLVAILPGIRASDTDLTSVIVEKQIDVITKKLPGASTGDLSSAARVTIRVQFEHPKRVMRDESFTVVVQAEIVVNEFFVPITVDDIDGPTAERRLTEEGGSVLERPLLGMVRAETSPWGLGHFHFKLEVPLAEVAPDEPRPLEQGERRWIVHSKTVGTLMGQVDVFPSEQVPVTMHKLDYFSTIQMPLEIEVAERLAFFSKTGQVASWSLGVLFTLSSIVLFFWNAHDRKRQKAQAIERSKVKILIP